MRPLPQLSSSVRTWRAWGAYGPDLAVGIGIGVFLLCLLVPRIQAAALSSGDTFMHIRLGREMIDSGWRIPRVDHLSFTRDGQPYVMYQWASALCLAILARVFASDGIVLYSAAAYALLSALVVARLQRRGFGAGSVVFALLAMSSVYRLAYSARPHMLSTVFFAVGYLWLDGRPCSTQVKNPWRAPLSAFILMSLWSCFHPASVLFFLLLGIELFASVVTTRASLGAAATTIAAAAVGLVATPLGVQVPLSVIDFYREPIFSDLIREHMPLELNLDVGAPILACAASALLSLALAAFQRRRAIQIDSKIRVSLCPLDLGEAISFFLLFALTIRSRRWGVVLAVVSLPLIAQWTRSLRPPTRAAAETSAPGPLATPRNSLWVVAILAPAIVFLRSQPGRLSLPIFLSRSGQPVAAARYLGRNPQSVGPRLYNIYSFGGFLEFALPLRKAFIDGRADFFGPDLLIDAHAIRLGSPDTPSLLKKYDFDGAIYGATDPLRRMLKSTTLRAAGWREIYFDGTAAISVRDVSSSPSMAEPKRPRAALPPHRGQERPGGTPGVETPNR